MAGGLHRHVVLWLARRKADLKLAALRTLAGGWTIGAQACPYAIWRNPKEGSLVAEFNDPRRKVIKG